MTKSHHFISLMQSAMLLHKPRSQSCYRKSLEGKIWNPRGREAKCQINLKNLAENRAVRFEIGQRKQVEVAPCWMCGCQFRSGGKSCCFPPFEWQARRYIYTFLLSMVNPPLCLSSFFQSCPVIALIHEIQELLTLTSLYMFMNTVLLILWEQPAAGA